MRPTLRIFSFWVILCGLSLNSVYSLDLFKIVSSRIPKQSVRIEKFLPCEEFPNTPVQFKNLTINQVAFNEFSLWGIINITEPFDRPMRVESELSRCFGTGDFSNCEYYFTYRRDRACDVLEAEGNIWEYFTKKTDFPKKCPFPPKTYHLNGTTIDLKAISYMPLLQSSHWHLKNKAFKNDELMFCVISQITIKLSMGHSFKV